MMIAGHGLLTKVTFYSNDPFNIITISGMI